MKHFQPSFQLLNLLVLQRTSTVGGMELGCFGVGNRNHNQHVQERHLTSRVIGGTKRGWMRSMSGLLGNGSMRLSLRNAARQLDLLAQAAGVATIAGVINAADALNLRDRIADGLSGIALQFSDLPSIKTSEPRLKGGGSRRLYVAST